MDEKFMKVLREQQEIQQKAARILHDTEKMKEEVQNKLESLKRNVENDFKSIGEFLKEVKIQFASYEYMFPKDDCKSIQINEQKYQTYIYVVINHQTITGTYAWDSCTDSITINCTLYICTHWESIYAFIQKKLIETVHKNNQTLLQEALNKQSIVRGKLEQIT